MRSLHLRYSVAILLAITVLASIVTMTHITNAQDTGGIAILVSQSSLSRSDIATLQITLFFLGDKVAGPKGFESVTLVMLLPNESGGLGTYVKVVLTPSNASFTFLKGVNIWVVRKQVSALPAGILTEIIIKHHNMGFDHANVSLLDSAGKTILSRSLKQHWFETESNAIYEVVPILMGSFGFVSTEPSLIVLPGGGKSESHDWAEIRIVTGSGATLYSDKLSMSDNEYFEKSATIAYGCVEGDHCIINVTAYFDIRESVVNAIKESRLGSTISYGAAIKLLEQGKLPYVALVVIQRVSSNVKVIARAAPILKPTNVITRGSISLKLYDAPYTNTFVDVYLVMVGENKAYVSATRIILLPKYEAKIFSNFSTNISELKSQVGKLMRELQNSIESVKGSVKLLGNNLGTLKSNVSRIKNKVDSLAVELNNAEKSIAKLKSLINESVSKLNMEVNDLNGKIGSLSGDLNKLSQKLTNLEDSISTIDGTLKQLKERLSSISEELSNAKNTATSNLASIKTLNTVVGNIDSKVRNLITTTYVAVGLGILGILLGIVGVAVARRGRA